MKGIKKMATESKVGETEESTVGRTAQQEMARAEPNSCGDTKAEV